MEEDIKILEEILHTYNLMDYRFGNMLTVKQTNAIENILAEIEKKDKTIDEMAKAIGHNNDIDYEICDNVHEQGFECDGYSREMNKTCENCIKQYFEKKVEEDNERNKI